MTIKEVKKMDTSKVRNMCIRCNWYTAGNNADYENMFSMCNDNITPEKLYEIAKDIYEHTNVDKAKEGCSSDYDDLDNISDMMIYLNDCTYVWYEIIA